MCLKRHIAWFIPACLAAGGMVSVFALLFSKENAGLQIRLPGEVSQGGSAPAPGEGPAFGSLASFEGVASNFEGSWPRFRGAGFDGVSRDQASLARSWPEGGPEEIWSVRMGEGHAGAAVLSGRVYVMDYDRETKADVVRCLSLADGRDIWRYSYPVKVKRNHGMSRTVPAVTDRFVVTLGPKCHVACLDSETGGLLWAIDLAADYGTTVPPWYAGQCPLIDQGKAIIAPAGSSLVIAVECETGKILWESDNSMKWEMTHSSVVPMELDGRRMYVYCGSGGVCGVDAGDGRILWQTDQWTVSVANIPSPVPLGGGRILLSGGYNAGAAILHLSGGGFEARISKRLGPDVFGSPQQTPILYEGRLYAVIQDGRFACLDESGRLLWSSPASERFGLGPYVIADGLVYLMDNEGVLTLAEASPAGFVKLARAKVLNGPDAWAPMAVAADRLICRDLTEMKCLYIGKGAPSSGPEVSGQ